MCFEILAKIFWKKMGRDALPEKLISIHFSHVDRADFQILAFSFYPCIKSAGKLIFCRSFQFLEFWFPVVFFGSSQESLFRMDKSFLFSKLTLSH